MVQTTKLPLTADAEAPITFDSITAEKIPQLAVMADEIWHEFFPGVISEAQIDYMVEKFQSPKAIEAQITEQEYEYYFIQYGDFSCGYLGFRPDGERLFLSKLYLKREYRGGASPDMPSGLFGRRRQKRGCPPCILQ